VTEWWLNYFDEIFLGIYRPLLDGERSVKEVDAIVELLQPASGARLLDVACGWGRHSVELARLGFTVTGVDLSTRLLEEAADAAREEGVAVRWLERDIREMDFDGEFDGALSLFSSLGYFASDEEDLRVLTGIRRALRPGGLFLLDTMHRDSIAREFLERDWWVTPEGTRVWVEREFDPVEGVSHETLRWRSPEGAEGEKRHSIRVRSATEWRNLLAHAGLPAQEWFGDWDLEPLSHASDRLIALCRRG